MSEERCSECGVSAADCSLEYGMCPLCANSEWDSETFTLRPRTDKDAEITALRAALDQERADNAKLRAFAHMAAKIAVEMEEDAFGLSMELERAGLIDEEGNPTELLSGRVEALVAMLRKARGYMALSGIQDELDALLAACERGEA